MRKWRNLVYAYVSEAYGETLESSNLSFRTDSPLMKKLKTLLILALLFLFSFLLRLSLISKGPFHTDTLNLALLAEKTLNEGQLHYFSGPGFPLTVLLSAVFIGLTKIFSCSDPVIGTNLMSVVISSLCVPALYYFTKKLFNPGTALIASILFSVFPIFLAISVYGNTHTPALFFLLISLCWLMDYKETSRRRNFIWSAIFMGFMGASRLQEMLVMTIPLSFLLITITFKRRTGKDLLSSLKHLTGFWAVTAITIFVFFIPLLLKQNPIHASQNFTQFFHYHVIESFQGMFSSPMKRILNDLNESFSYSGVFNITMGVLILGLRDRLKLFFLLFWFITPLLILGNFVYAAPRFFVVASLPLIIIMGYILNSLPEQKPRWWQICIYLILIVTICSMLKNILPILAFRHRYALMPDYYRWVGQNTEPNAKIIERDNISFIEHYGHRTAIYPPVSLFAIDPHALERFKEDLDRDFASNVPIYVTGTGLLGYNPNLKFPQFMKEHFQIKFIGERLIEDWHRDCLKLDIGPMKLYRLRPQPRI